MQNTYKWNLVPSSYPTITRSCPKCGSHSEYQCTGNFRVNANKNNLDVWLIYQCSKCKSTWNMELLSRVNANTIDKVDYQKFLQNDNELVIHYAFDVVTHRSNKATMNYDGLSYHILGDPVDYATLQSPCEIELTCNYPIDLRLDRLLSRHLGLSREEIKTMGRYGKITDIDGKDLSKAKIKNRLMFLLHP